MMQIYVHYRIYYVYAPLSDLGEKALAVFMWCGYKINRTATWAGNYTVLNSITFKE